MPDKKKLSSTLLHSSLVYRMAADIHAILIKLHPLTQWMRPFMLWVCCIVNNDETNIFNSMPSNARLMDIFQIPRITSGVYCNTRGTREIPYFKRIY